MKPPRSWIFDLSAIGLHDRLLPHASAVWVAVWEEQDQEALTTVFYTVIEDCSHSVLSLVR